MGQVEEALRDHVRCERLGAMILPGFCANYRPGNANCKGCEQAEEMDRLAANLPPVEKRKVRKSPPRVPVEGKGEDMGGKKRTGPCACGCGKEGTIIGRGLVGGCYHKHRKAGTLDSFPAATTGRNSGGEGESGQKMQDEPAAARRVDAGHGGGAGGPETGRGGEGCEDFGTGAVDDAGGRGCSVALPGASSHSVFSDIGSSGPEQILLTFEPRDAELLRILDEAAYRNRRSLPAEILYRLERGLS